MTALRRALAALALPALAATAPTAQAADIWTQPCVPYIADQPTMLVSGSGFHAGATVALATNHAAASPLRPLDQGRADAAGALPLVTTLPPPFDPTGRNVQTFSLVAAELADPHAPVLATTTFQVVRFGLARSPKPRYGSSRVTFTARGFTPGQPVYLHFRFGGVTRRTVSLGAAQGPCGIASRRMRALPTRARYGAWRVYVDQSPTFAPTTLPQWVDAFRIYRAGR